MDYKYFAGPSPLFSRFPLPGNILKLQQNARCVEELAAPTPKAPAERLPGEDAGGGDVSQIRAPFDLSSAFCPEKEVLKWPGDGRFTVVKKLMDASRNKGEVFLMQDTTDGRRTAVKVMPNTWMLGSHEEFLAKHPHETEHPWQDIGVLRFLNRVRFPYMCDLQGVYRDDLNTYVRTSFATEGDLFKWCEGGPGPGIEREALIMPLAIQILKGIQRMHDMSMLHRDISLENVLLSRSESDGELDVKIIDYSMASTTRWLRNTVTGKASYQAPELHGVEEYDGFLSDTFAVGVTIYALLVKDYPWLSTRPGGCKCFEYVRNHGLRTFMAKRKVRESVQRVTEVTSEPVKSLLEGMLQLDPSQRLTLGETKGAYSERKSVWDETWIFDKEGGRGFQTRGTMRGDAADEMST